MVLRRYTRQHGQSALALIEVIVAATLIGLVGVASIEALGTLNRDAAVNRIFTNARSVVQRNCDTALNVTLNSGTTPAILAITGSSGVVYDDDGGTPLTVAVAVQGSAGVTVVTGTLTRTVTAVSNSDNADIRQVTFLINYMYGSRPFSYKLTTMRAADD